MSDDLHKAQLRIRELERNCAALQTRVSRLKKQCKRQEKVHAVTRRTLRTSNEKLHHFQEQSRLANLSKSDFLANMSHEIRTPLNIILGMATLLADTRLDETQSKYLASLRLTGRQLMEILNNIIEFSRIETGSINVEQEAFSLQSIIGQLEASALPLCLQKNLAFIIDCPPVLVMERIGDPVKIFQVLLNLLNNAVKFTRYGSITLRLEEKSPGEIIFSVNDTGVGIAQKDLNLIFERFVQADEPEENTAENRNERGGRRRHGGAGLGLAICRKLVQAMGGSIDVSSKPNQGATFTCRLPLPCADRNDRQRLRQESTVIQPSSFPRLSILAVDDIGENLEVIRVYLKDYPITVTCCENGKKALELMTVNHYDIVLMDVRMPVMNGVAATRQIRSREDQETGEPRIILAVTAHAFGEQRKRFMEAGFNGVLTKPFFRRELITTLFRFSKQAIEPPHDKLCNKAVGYCLEKETPEQIPSSLLPLLPQLHSTMRKELTSMGEQLKSHKYDDIRVTAHGLKGVAGMFGYRRLSGLIEDLGTSVKAGRYELAGELLRGLEAYVDELHHSNHSGDNQHSHDNP